MAVEIYGPVEARLEEVWIYTKRKWGPAQADKYMRGLWAAIREIDRKRKNWKRFTELEIRGLYYFRYEHHHIFFREFSDEIVGVITVLHESMDLSARLREDWDSINE